jgi:hypothetical protein
VKPNYIGKPMSTWPLRKIVREHKFALADHGPRHGWTRLLRQELIRRRRRLRRGS